MSSCKSCNDFANARRKSENMVSAIAGEGLPSIEPGMPNPAGTGLDRRQFMLRAGGMAMSVYGASKLGIGAFEEGIAHAAGAPSNTVLVSVFLPGGADALSILAPTTDPIYQAKRPNLKLVVNNSHVFADDPRLQWHPSALGLKTLHEAGKVAVFPSIGYSHPDQSHFTSRHYWEVGALDANANVGWLGRFLDQEGTDDNPLQGLSLGNYLAPALAAERVPTASVNNPTAYDFWANGIGDPVSSVMYETFGKLGLPATNDPDLRTARRAARQTDGVRRSMASLVGATVSSGVTYPTSSDGFPTRLAAVAQMLSLGMPLRCVSIEAAGGYDTHSDQAAGFTRDLKLTVDTLVAFQADLEARGLADRVVIQVWSEFGRRVEQNGNSDSGSGTDHGAAGVAFLVGTKVRRQLVGEWSGLNTLDAGGNMLHTSDFRVMYAALVDQWLGGDAAAVIPGADSMVLPTLITA